MRKIIPFEQPLRPTLPTIEGNVDYRLWKSQIQRIEGLLLTSGLETEFLQLCLNEWSAPAGTARPERSVRVQLRFQESSRKALRCNIARILLNEDFRGFAVRVADSALLQRFCLLSQLDRTRVPSKSTLERYSKWVPEQRVRELVLNLLKVAGESPEQIALANAVDLETCFLDSTCVSAHIHFPVDWVLFRDATRTLMKSVRLIRDQGLKHRMEAPEIFRARMNRLCIQMTHARGKEDGQKRRKCVLRQMDRLLGLVRKHARRYRDLLDQQWTQTQWSRAEAEQVLQRMDRVLTQLPAARRQARQRILKGELVNNADKILSLYEEQVRVIVRGKAGADVEFGNTLLLGESPAGLILDWKYFAESAPADAKLLRPSLERMEAALGRRVRAVGGDRGFDSQDNREYLVGRGTYNGTCPRAPKELQQRLDEKSFRELQRRRAQTEGRIAVFKNNILGGQLLSKGFEHRQLTITWAVLSHNLWVLARLPQAEVKVLRKAA